MRGDEALAGVKILMLTAKGRDTDIAKGQALGADAYMTKPFSTKELAEKVRELLAHESRPALSWEIATRAAGAALAPATVDRRRAACRDARSGPEAWRPCRAALAGPARRAACAGRLLAAARARPYCARRPRRSWTEEGRRRLARCRCRSAEKPGGAGRAETAARAPADQPADQPPARRAARRTAAQVRLASRSVEQESNRLAALMAELTQSVVV